MRVTEFLQPSASVRAWEPQEVEEKQEAAGAAKTRNTKSKPQLRQGRKNPLHFFSCSLLYHNNTVK